MYKEKYIEKANIPQNFKIYESRDGMFTDRIGPYFIKGRYPEVTLGMRIFEHHSNLNGVAHGGLLMAFVDTIGGYIAAKAGKSACVTANLNSYFMKPVPINSWIEGSGKALRTGKRAIFIRVELMLDKNLVFAADGIWQKINREKGIPKS